MNYSGINKKFYEANKLLLLLCLAFSLSCSISIIGIFDFLNKVIIAFLCITIVIIFCYKKQPRTTYLILSISAILHSICLIYPISPKEGIATYFTFAFWILFWLYLASNISEFLNVANNEKHIIKNTLIVWSILTLISFALPFCYKVSWGGERYFVSFTTSSFEVAPVAVFMLALNILLYKFEGKKIQAVSLSIVPLACVFATGTRTYLVVILVELIILIKMMVKNKSVFILVSIAVIICAIFVASVSSIGKKFESAIFETDDIGIFLEVFTNGRSRFWEIDVQAFLSGNLFQIMFGHGFSYVYDLNEMTIGNRLYSHNDFINILLNFGVAGMIIYFISFAKMISLIRKKIGIGFCCLFIFMWLFNAFFNMIYVYVVAVIAMGVLAGALLGESDYERYKGGE